MPRLKNGQRERYKDKLVSPDEAAEKVKSGDLVAFTWGRDKLFLSGETA